MPFIGTQMQLAAAGQWSECTYVKNTRGAQGIFTFWEHLESEGAMLEPLGGSNFLGAPKTRTALGEYAFSFQAQIVQSAGLEALKSGCLRNTHGA